MNGDKPHNKEIARLMGLLGEATLKVKSLEKKEKRLKEWLDNSYEENYGICCNYAEGEALGYSKTSEFIENDYKEIDNGK